MNLLYRLYFMLPGFSHSSFCGRVINRLLGIILSFVFDLFVPSYYKRTVFKQGMGVRKEKRTREYIISLTSFPARIHSVWITIESLMRQSVKADRILLWLAEEQFPDRKVPKSLLFLKERGLEICWCKNLRSHTKYYYTMKQYPDSCVITFDDDIYYPNDVVENLDNLHRNYPDMIVANRAHKIVFKDKKCLPYRKWNINYSKEYHGRDLLLTGVGGVLYPPYSLNEDLFRIDLIKKYCYFADDIWLYMQAIRNGTEIVTNDRYDKDFITIGGSQKENLVRNNVFLGGNDKQLKDVCGLYQIDLFNRVYIE